MKLFNTLSRQVEDFKPIAQGKASVYTCGPTVYDYPHIGNWFTFIRYDILVRVLKLNGFDVNWVLNITDVGHLISDADEGEDKLEKGARREGKSAQDIAAFYTKYFFDGLNRLNFQTPTVLPRATEHIKDQISLIETLEQKGFTYIIDDGVYYDVSKFPDYDKFAGLDMDQQLETERINPNPMKRNPQDFALWKFSPKGKQRDMEWDSPWGRGFPGWHIECSAIILALLGETIDIHSGGIDHIPVHHTNEIAQSQAATGKPLANYWMHTNHILIDDQKIAKSTGNGLTLEDVEKAGISLEAFRLLVLQSHYRTQSRFSWDELEAAQNRLRSLRAMADLRWQIVDFDRQDYQAEKKSGAYQEYPLEQADFERYTNEITKELNDDLATPKALAYLSEIEEQANLRFISKDSEPAFLQFLDFIDQALGLRLGDSKDINDTKKALISSREAARDVKDWKKADKLRDKLEAEGLRVRDTAKYGSIWYRI